MGSIGPRRDSRLSRSVFPKAAVWGAPKHRPPQLLAIQVIHEDPTIIDPCISNA
jgi:hypothetical protein